MTSMFLPRMLCEHIHEVTRNWVDLKISPVLYIHKPLKVGIIFFLPSWSKWWERSFPSGASGKLSPIKISRLVFNGKRSWSGMQGSWFHSQLNCCKLVQGYYCIYWHLWVTAACPIWSWPQIFDPFRRLISNLAQFIRHLHPVSVC